MTNLQILTTNGQPQWQTVYTPSGDYLAYTRLDGEVDIWKILSTGMVDTTKVWHFPLGSLNSRFLTITPNGTHIYVSYEGPSLQGISRLDWYSQDTPFVNSGSFTPLSYPIQVEVSPDGQFLVAVQQVVNKHYLRTYSIQADGSLVDTGYSFPYTDTFGDTINNASNLIFVYPPAPTDVPSELWGKLE